MTSIGASGRIEPWKLDLVRRYLERRFPDARVDDYVRGGGIAHLFQVLTKHATGQRRVAHQLLITRKFFDRYTDATSLRQELLGSAVPRASRSPATAPWSCTKSEGASTAPSEASPGRGCAGEARARNTLTVSKRGRPGA